MWVGHQSRRRNLSSVAGARSVDNADDCAEPCTVYVGSDHFDRRTPRELYDTLTQCRVVEQADAAVVRLRRQFVCPCARHLDELKAGRCTGYQIWRCGIVVLRLDQSGYAELVVR